MSLGLYLGLTVGNPALNTGGGVPAPVESQDWATDEYSPSPDSFTASTTRVLTGADGKSLTEFAIDALRRRDGWGALIEPARTRLTGPPSRI